MVLDFILPLIKFENQEILDDIQKNYNFIGCSFFFLGLRSNTS